VDKDLALRLGMNQFLIRFGGEFDQEIHKVFFIFDAKTQIKNTCRLDF